MATPSSARIRAILYLVAGILLLVVQGIRLAQYYPEWQRGTLDTPHFVLGVVFVVFALYMMRAGWKMLRHRDDLLD